jgi:uncharacterized iron-regulated membrane protein
MIEIAASLGMVLIATGLYMWWPRNAGWRAALIPSVGRGGRAMWRSLHGVVGFWISLFLVFFLISGLSWAGIWGEKMVQAWSQFPAEKWDNVPLSDDTHASMNHGPKEVPWALEQTPMPASGSQAGNPGLAAGTEVTIDSMDKLARAIGFDGRYQMNVPTGETGVYTFSRDSMSTTRPTRCPTAPSMSTATPATSWPTSVTRTIPGRARPWRWALPCTWAPWACGVFSPTRSSACRCCSCAQAAW